MRDDEKGSEDNAKNNPQAEKKGREILEIVPRKRRIPFDSSCC
jgi:hypothetical protein